jgi:hypothetical protein
MLFAPFFSGSAGTGMSWHWESYVHKNNLWYHFGRFHEAIKGINPLEEYFAASQVETDSLRVYVLKGRKSTLVWLRDKSSNWQSELEQKIPVKTMKQLTLPLEMLGAKQHSRIQVYAPWQNKWHTVNVTDRTISLPDFKRSLVLRFEFR